MARKSDDTKTRRPGAGRRPSALPDAQSAALAPAAAGGAAERAAPHDPEDEAEDETEETELVEELEPEEGELEVEALSAQDELALVPMDARGRRDPRALVLSRPSLVRRDPLQAYMNEARRYPLLTPEEEHELAVRYHTTGDLDAARRMVTANLRLVVKIAHEYRKAYQSLLDLVQEGNIGLMHAVKKFDPYRGVKLTSYAAWWIRAYILKFILNNWRLVKIGTTQSQRKLFFNLRREMERLQRLGVEEPAPRLLAERLSVPEHEVQSMQRRLAGQDVSLDAPARSDDPAGGSRLDLVAASSSGPDQLVEEEEFTQRLAAKVREFGQSLDGRDREIFELRTVAEEPLTLQEIGDKYGITRERARQLERRMMNRLREFLREELGDAVQVALGREDDE
ncbi:MAG: RNA polymerase factor sigma-32 [Deltaproteobacteria bacterium]|nr:RNA polymerase factor sigma-32 [Deltaproteobacteria bacterium]